MKKTVQNLFHANERRSTMSVPYINYKDLDEFYTLKGVCQLLELDKQTLQEKCRQYEISPQRNEVGDWGLSR